MFNSVYMYVFLSLKVRLYHEQEQAHNCACLFKVGNALIDILLWKLILFLLW